MMQKPRGRTQSARSILADLLKGQEIVSEELSARLLSLIEDYESKLKSGPSAESDEQQNYESLTGIVAPYLAEGLVLVHVDTAQILYGTPRMYEMYGWEPGELTGKPVGVLNSPNGQDPTELARRIISSTQQEGRWQGEVLGVRKDGSEFRVLVSAGIIEHPEFGRVQVSSQLDITDRMQDQVRYQALFEASQDAILILSPDAKIVAVNQQFLELTGYSKAEVIGRDARQMVLSSEAEDADERFGRLLSGDRVPVYERVAQRKNGEIFVSEVSIALVKDLSDQPLYVQAIIRNVSDRKQNEARFRALFDRNNDGVLFLDLKRTIIAANLKAAELSGYTVEELVGMNARELIAEREFNSADRRHDQLLSEKNVPVYERTARRKDGSEYAIEVSASMVADSSGDPVHVQIMFRDISERKRSQARYRALFDQVQDSVILYDTDGIIIAANEQAGKMIGYPVDELVGMQIRNLIAEREIESMQGLRQRLLDGETLGIFERIAKRADGSEYQVEIDMSLVYVEEGKPPYIQSIVRDITERKRDEARFKALFDRNSDAVVLLDLQGKIMAVNRSAVEMTGYSQDELESMYAWDIVAEGDVEASKGRLSAVLDAGRLGVYERKARRKNGEEYFVEVNASLVSDAEGNPLHIQTMIRDISERKASELRYRALFENTHDAIFIVGLDGRNLLANRQAATMLGYTVEELIGTRVEDLLPPREAHDSADRLMRLMAGEDIPIYERVVRHKEGTEILIEISASLVRDASGEPVHIQTVFRDITERRESESRYRALFEHMHDGVLIIGLDGQTLMANPQAVAMLGYSLDELLATQTGSLLTEQEAQDAHRRHAQLLAGEEVPTYERVIRRKNGDEITIEINMSLIRDAHGEPRHVQSVFRDITERKRTTLRYESLLEANQDSVVIFGLDGIILEANDQAAQMTGYSREELVGMSARTFVSPKEYQHLGEVQKRLLAGETLPRYQRIGIRKDGSEFVMEINMTVVRDERGEPSHWQSISRDITERIRNEEETLVQSQITAHLTEGLMLVRASDDVIVFANPSMHHMFGYEPGEMVGMHVWDLNSKGDQTPQKTARQISDVIRKSGSWQGEILNVRKSGETFWTYASSTTIDHYEHGEVYLSTQVDITDRKRLEQELIFQGAIARNLSESVNLVQVSDQTIVYTNDRFDELFGYAPGEMIGRHVTALNPPPPHEGVPPISEMYMRQVEVDGHWQGEILNVRKDGSLFWTLASVALIEHPEYDKVYIATRVDITDRVEATNRLQATLARLDHLIRSMNVVVYTFDLAEGLPVTYMSESAERLLGFPASDFVDDPQLIQKRAHPEDVKRLVEDGGFDPDSEEQVIEYRYQHANGEWLWLQDYIRILRDEEGNILEGLGVKLDITEARKAQENLNRAVRLAAGGEVAAGVAHQINNPLTIILAQTSLIQQNVPPDSKMHASLDIILRAVDRAGKVVQRLLYMSKVLPYDYEPVDLNQTLESTAALVMAQFEADRSSIMLDLDPDLPPISASESHLQDVWLNILINARDAVAAGEPVNVRIESRLVDDGTKVKVRISDDGPGIAPENLDSIFLPLYTTKAQHTGLGLPFCMEVVTRHGGIMEVDSVLGQGATFIITLPVEPGKDSKGVSI